MKKFIQQNSLYLAWAAALVGALGSLYFSEVLKFPPCTLCWFLRIAIYPQVIILGYAIYLKEKVLLKPAIALTVVGVVISIYHNLLYYKVIPEAVAPCTSGVSCTSNFIHLFGFMDIPQLGLVGIVTILILLLIAQKYFYDQRS